MDFNSTVKGSALEGFYPAGWDFEKIDACIGAPETITDHQAHWNDNFTPIKCESLGEFETYMGHEIAMQIKLAKERGEKIAFILPVGPMGMYKWVVYFLKAWNVSCEHVHTFNMDEWADGEGNTLPADNTGSFKYAMEQALFGPLGELTVPVEFTLNKNGVDVSVDPTKIEENEHMDIAEQYDYYAVPSFFDGKTKLFEAHLYMSYEDIREEVRKVLDYALAD